MSSNKFALIAVLILVVFTNTILGQTPTATQPGAVSSVTGSITAEGAVRMIAHGESPNIRMEVYSQSGDLISDSGLRQGSIIDWKQTDATQPMADGLYLIVVTVRDFKGNLNQRLAALSLQGGKLVLQQSKREEVTTAQTQAMETRRQGKNVKIADGDDTVSVLREGKDRSVVVAGHDGTDGQVSSTSGALTFRTGNVFTNQESEQLRITPEGRVGIGTKNPEATLDVSGSIKAQSIQFDDGTVINSAKGLPEKDAPSAGGGGGGMCQAQA